MTIQTLGVVGAGTIGSTLAQSAAQKGLTVILVDIADEQLTRSRRKIEQESRLQRLFRKENIPANFIEKITFTTDYAALSSADYVVENATEKWEVKHTIYPRLEQICADEVVFAANTSAISITRLGSIMTRPGRLIGAHFMNPVPLMPAVEVIRGVHTSDATFARTEELLTLLDKQTIPVNDYPGFITNRVLMLTINEAIFCLQDNVASVQNIDRIFKQCFGHKMGPLETADLIGLDTILNSLLVLHDSYNDSKYRPAPLLKQYVHAGWLGRKSGRGFYDYQVVPDV